MRLKEKRKIDLLNRIVQQYIRSGQPVGSRALVQRYHLSKSAATVRSLMALLEDEGYIYQPYTSAGRVPTEAAYGVYIQYLKPTRPAQSQIRLLARVVRAQATPTHAYLRHIAKLLAELTGDVVIFATSPDVVYTTGFRCVTQRTEFQDRELLQDISNILDHIDEHVVAVFEDIGFEPEIRIGSRSGFGDQWSAVFMRYRFKGASGLFAIIGPLRMDYARNVALLGALQKYFS